MGIALKELAYNKKNNLLLDKVCSVFNQKMLKIVRFHKDQIRSGPWAIRVRKLAFVYFLEAFRDKFPFGTALIPHQRNNMTDLVDVVTGEPNCLSSLHYLWFVSLLRRIGFLYSFYFFQDSDWNEDEYNPSNTKLVRIQIFSFYLLIDDSSLSLLWN